VLHASLLRLTVKKAEKASSPHVVFRAMRVCNIPAARKLWTRSEGVELAEGDRRAELTEYLARNPGTSYVALSAGTIIGAVLAGHGNRRGFLYHLAVDSKHRGTGIGRELVDRSLAMLKSMGMKRALLLVATNNRKGCSFWKKCGWESLSFAKPMGIDL